MDPIGFGIGVVGLAGLVSTCIQGFQIIRAMKAFNRDTQLIFTKLDIERDLLMQWAHQCGLLKRQHVDGRLFNPATDTVIHKTLREIAILLVDAANLQRKYLPAHHDRNDQRGDYSADGFKIGLRRKFMYTISDKDEFNHLIADLGYFVEKLFRLIPSLEQRRAMREDLQAIGCDASTLHLLQYKSKRDRHGHRHEDVDSTISIAADLASTMGSSRRTKTHKRRSEDDQFQPPPPPSYSQSELSYSSDRSSYGSRSSHTSRGSSHSTSSKRSRQSSGNAAREMWGDLTGKNRHCSSAYR